MRATVQRLLPLAVIAALLAAAALWYFGSDNGTKTVTAYFPRTVSIYEGSDVRVLGVPIGKVDTVTPEGTKVKVVMHYDDEVKLPGDAEAVIVSPSVVGDRYIQITPAYEKGPELADGTELDVQRTAVPLELDEIYGNLDRLAVALGPEGANSEGALTDLLEQTARNFGGQGAEFRQTIEDFGQLSSTLDDNKEELFASAEQLQGFIETLADNDTTVRRFNRSLGDVSQMLEGEREELGTALHNLGIALDVVGGFVQDNRAALGRNISGLNRLAKVVVKRRTQLNEVLRAAPLALNNLGGAYNPQAGTLDSNANIGNLVHNLTNDPAQLLCTLIAADDPRGRLCELIQGLPLPRNAPFAGFWSERPFDPTLNGLVPEEAS